MNQVVISANVQETFSDWPDDESNAIIVFFVGCEHNCKGCHNSHLADYQTCLDNAALYPNTLEKEFIKFSVDSPSAIDCLNFIKNQCNKHHTNKVILQGGDPFSIYNRDFVMKLLILNKVYFGLEFCIYTGYDIDSTPLVKENVKFYKQLVKFVKCGTYREDLFQEPGKDKEKIIFASTNQCLYDSEYNLLSKNGIYYFGGNK